MRAPEARILVSSRDHARAPYGWTDIELSREHLSIGLEREPSRTDPCSSRTRPAWLMLGLGSGILGMISTMVPLVQHGLPVLRRTQGFRWDRSEPSRAASAGGR